MKSRIYELNLIKKEKEEINLEYSLKLCKYKLTLNKNDINIFLMKHHKIHWLDVLNTGNSIYAMYSESMNILTYFIFRLLRKFTESNSGCFQESVEDTKDINYKSGYKLLDKYGIDYQYWYDKENISIASHTAR